MTHAAATIAPPDIQLSYAGLDDLGMVVVVDGGAVLAWAERSLSTVEQVRLLRQVRAQIAERAATGQTGPAVLLVRRSVLANGATSRAAAEGDGDGHVDMAESGAEGAAAPATGGAAGAGAPGA